jgi:hypothetical protein
MYRRMASVAVLEKLHARTAGSATAARLLAGVDRAPRTAAQGVIQTLVFAVALQQPTMYRLMGHVVATVAPPAPDQASVIVAVWQDGAVRALDTVVQVVNLHLVPAMTQATATQKFRQTEPVGLLMGSHVLDLVSETAVPLRGGAARLPPIVVMVANRDLVLIVLHSLSLVGGPLTFSMVNVVIVP